MAVYLRDIPLSEAQARIQSMLEEAGLWRALGRETLPLSESLIGRVTAEPIWAKLSSPYYHSAAMDGFAIRAEDSNGAMPTAPVMLFVGSQAVYVDTGDVLPDWANAVVPIEQVEALDEHGRPAAHPSKPFAIRLRAAFTPWSHVRPMGEDIVATQLVIPAGRVLRPVDLGAIAACGHTHVTVARKPRVTILPTGNELVPIGQEVKPGDIIEFNSLVLAAQVTQWGGEVIRFPITPDDEVLIAQRVLEAAADSDLILLNAGSSAGSEDFSAQVIERLGKLAFHGVAVRPGHPVIFGMVRRPIANGKSPEVPIFGVPGYPVSAALTGEIFIEPLMALWTGRESHQPEIIKATITRKVTSPAGDDDYLRVVVGEVGGRVLAAPLSRGAGVITSLVRADGIVVIPSGVQGLESGETVEVRLYCSSSALSKTLFVIGSHDMTLDLLAQFLSEKGVRLVSANIGSLGGLVALRRGEAHLAGSHLLDPETGTYNLRYVRQYLPNEPVMVVHWVGREQGLIVRKGNPKGIQGLEDLIREDVRFVNRQRGAGTRVLLDYHLGRIGITPEQIRGYDQEEYTHLAVAAAVASGRADCGLGVTAAAHALGLDFIPLFQELYDLVIPCRYLQDSRIQPIFDLMQSTRFREAVAQLPGYDVTQMGRIVQECDRITP